MLEHHGGTKGQGEGEGGTLKCVREVLLLEEVTSEWHIRDNRSCAGKEGESESSSKLERECTACAKDGENCRRLSGVRAEAGCWDWGEMGLE